MTKRIRKNNRLWISWEEHRRSKELAPAFDCDYHCFDPAESGALRRYFLNTFATLRVFYNEKPTTVFVQCPSLGLAVVIATLKLFHPFTYIIDAHNALPNYEKSSNPIFRLAARFVINKADYVIVTNSELEATIQRFGGKALILPDKLPNIPPRPKPDIIANCETPVIVVVSSFAWDEPLHNILAGLSLVTAPFYAFVSGKKSKAGDLLNYESDKIRFTDYISDEKFEALIQHASLIIDMTTDDRILVCGAYEAIAVGVPVLLADFPVSRQLFRKGALFTKNEVEAYQQVIQKHLLEPSTKKAEIIKFKTVFEATWLELFTTANHAISLVESP